MSKEPQCPYVSAAGRHCTRDLAHDGPHWLEAEPHVTSREEAKQKKREERTQAEVRIVNRERPTDPRSLALAVDEHPQGRIAAAIVYLADSLKPPPKFYRLDDVKKPDPDQ